jgi:hypothetical protein
MELMGLPHSASVLSDFPFLKKKFNFMQLLQKLLLVYFLNNNCSVYYIHI